MPSRTFLTIACLVIVPSLLCVRAEAQPTFCLTPTAMPQTPPSPSPPPVCEPCHERCRESPCYVATGIYVTDATDLQIRTAGTIPLVASRLYDSSRGADGPLGTGWSSGLMPRLYYATYLFSAPSTYSHEADVVMPDGVIYRFAMSGGAFTPPFGRFETLVRNADQTYSLTLQHSRTVYRFAADGSVSSLTDDFGNVITWTYDSSGRVQRVADSAGCGRYIDLTWGADGRVSTLTDNSGRQVKYYYDASDGTLTGVADPTVSGNASLRSTNYAYGPGRFGKVLTQISDRWSRIISTLAWYSDGRLKSYTDGAYDEASPATSAGEKYTYTYYQSQTSKGNSLGTVSYPYDAAGLVNPPSYVNGQPATVTSPTGGTFQYEYDSAGRVAKMTVSPTSTETVVWWYTYDAAWPEQIASIIPKDTSGNLNTNWAGSVYDYYDSSSSAPGALAHVWRVRSDTITKDPIASYWYTSHGRLAYATDDNGITTAYTYNAAGDLLTIGIGYVMTQLTHDALGRALSVTDPNGHTTTNTYDGLDRIVSITLPKPSATAAYDTVTTFSYDNYDSSTSLTFTNTTDANGRITKAGYDALGHAVQTVDAAGNITQFTYQHDLLAKIRDANGNETNYGYSATRDLSSVTYPDGAIERYQFSNGVLAARTDRLGNTMQYTYDGLGRLATAPGQSYNYSGQRPASLNDGNITHTYSYDSSWRLVTDAIFAGETKTYTYYGAVSRLNSYTIQPPSGAPSQSVTYGYTAYGQVASEIWSWIPNGQFAFAYTPSGQYSSITFPNGQQRSFTYDNQDRLTNIANTSPGGNTLASYDYAYDYDWQTSSYSMRGQRTSVYASVSGGPTKYSYDARYQLVRTDYQDGNFEAWTYDAIGNRLSKRQTYAFYPYSYYTNASGGNTQRLRNDSSSSSDFTYDAAGNLTGANGVTNAYVWYGAGQLASYGGTTYGYDAFGRTSASTGGSTTRYISMNGNTVGERNTTTGVATDYLFGPGIDEPLAKRTANGSITYYGVDGLGSVIFAADPTGAVPIYTVYSPWGETTFPPTELFGYTGRETGGPAWYNRARYYDAPHGRFLSEDPLRFSSSGPLYAYVDNDPLDSADPDGLCPWQVRSRVMRGFPSWSPRFAQHSYFYNTVTGESIGLGPVGFGPLASSVPGQWERREQPRAQKQMNDQKEQDVPDASCDCVSRQLAKPGKAPDYCTIPPLKPLWRPRPCNNCQQWIADILLGCS